MRRRKRIFNNSGWTTTSKSSVQLLVEYFDNRIDLIYFSWWQFQHLVWVSTNMMSDSSFITPFQNLLRIITKKQAELEETVNPLTAGFTTPPKISNHIFSWSQITRVLTKPKRNKEWLNSQKWSGIFEKIKEIFNISSRYCEDTVTCRRVMQLAHLGEKFDEKFCNKMCDNCRNSSTFNSNIVAKDITNECRKILSLYNELMNRKVELTQKQFIQALRGLKT